MTWSSAAILRLVAVGLVGGILQLTTVSQVAIFGVPADLTPLLVVSVGLLCGSIPGACFGFGLGLFMDTLLAQTLGLSSLVLLTAGTVSERLPSPFPEGILIGTVKRIEGEGELDRTIHVEPAADLRSLDFVQVLTRPNADLRASTTATP